MVPPFGGNTELGMDYGVMVEVCSKYSMQFSRQQKTFRYNLVINRAGTDACILG